MRTGQKPARSASNHTGRCPCQIRLSVLPIALSDLTVPSNAHLQRLGYKPYIGLMAEQIFLRVSIDSAKEQLKKRTTAARHDYGDAYDKERQEWSLINIRVLEAIFSSDQIANDYKEFTQRSLKNFGAFKSPVKDEANKFLRELIDRLPLFPEMKSPEAPATRARGTTVTPVTPHNMSPGIQWEFYSVIVDDPGLGKHMQKATYNETLKKLSEEGWDLISAVPVIYTEEKNQIFPQVYVEAFRLFLKRPRRL